MAANHHGTADVTGSRTTLYIMGIRFDVRVFRTLSGGIKATIVDLTLLTIICIQSSVFRSNNEGVFFTLVAIMGLLYTLFMFMLYACHVVENFPNFKWLQVELVVCLIFCLLHMIASTMAVAFGAVAFSAAGFFGYLLMVLYGAEAFLKARSIARGEPAQGSAKTSRAASPDVA